MKKQHAIIAGLVVAIILLLLLWRRVNYVEKPATYLDTAYPDMPLQLPALQVPLSGNSCGCNPQSTQYLTNVGNSINEAQNKIEQQLKQYTDSVNAFFDSQVYS